ncbi:ATP-binding cassette domain-containing protein [Duganella sp. FT50W]|uniref:ATP-binding cassette domain-containing protein n=1 Tax=Duganella lactea TaxID=2692173 RepID=A0A6L8MMW6_9BURK|nr:ATP-binding cassette domain-containing protein [Duganella lactea]MYM37090.1 ATP-binding cassette domain-containing protein [Duganella lactea]MYM83262.1 ATP-binding cassette domain-containing protein [Duganella lactea]
MQFTVDLQKNLRAGDRTFQLQARFASASQRVVVYGASGAGKSQMMKAVAGLMTPDSGRIELAGRCLFDSAAGVNLPPQQRKVAYLFQDYALFPHLNVRQNIGFGLLHGWRNPLARADHAAIRHWLDAFELTPVADQYPHQLSGGQRQRVALARALAPQPQALLLDEPFAALDPALRERMRAELDTVQRRLAIPMLMITHDPEDVRAFGDHVLRMEHGSIFSEEENAA